MTYHQWFIVIVVFTVNLKAIHAIRCPLKSVMIKNGDYSLGQSNTVARFTCNAGFTLYGNERIVCFGDTWHDDPPMCISNTCPKITAGPAMKIEKEYDGAVLKFSCTVLHRLVGTNKLVCDGEKWSDAPPSCEQWTPPTSCNFEDADLCGWSHHDEDDQEWRWQTGPTKTTRTGPDHDHTYGGAANIGHYMYFETSSPTRTGHQAWLSSPLYPDTYSDKHCFEFWYHSLGEGSIGTLEVFVKDEITNLTDSKRVFFLNASIDDQWHRESVSLTKQQHVFQIVFVATRGSGYRSDFAIDDVSLKLCNAPASPKPTIATTTVTNIVSTKAPTIKTSTTIKATTTTLMTPPTPSTKRTTTTIPSTTISSTLKPSTARPTLKPSTARTTRKPPTTIKQTTPKRPTTEPATTTKVSKATQITVTPSQSSNVDSKKSPQILVTQSTDGVSAETKVAYIFIGIGISVCVAIIIGVGVLVYQRKKKQIYYTKDSGSIGVDNLLYSVGSSDESAVQFNM